MKDSAQSRATIVNRLLSLNLSIQQELNDIIKLTTVLCGTPIVLITLLDDNEQFIQYSHGMKKMVMPFSESFCQHTIKQNDILEVEDAQADPRFMNLDIVVNAPGIRAYTGSALRTKSGDSIGSLCVLDTKPNKLTELQKQMLRILAHQVTTIFEFELSLKLLKEEIIKVQDSEMKLKAIFQSSPTSHLLLDVNMIILAHNDAAYNAIANLNGNHLSKGEHFPSLLPADVAEWIIDCFNSAVTGEQICVEKSIVYADKGLQWMSVNFNTVYDYSHIIIGVSIDSVNITSRIESHNHIIQQNSVLREIAQMQSHEIRRPVANILSLVELLQDKNDEAFDLHLNFLNKEVGDLDDKIHHIVDLTYQDKKLQFYADAI